MKNSALIAVLTITAILLTVILLTSNGNRAQASMLNAQADFTLMTAGAVGNDEMLIVIDKGANKMIVYNLVNGKNFKVVAGKNLNPAPIAPK